MYIDHIHFYVEDAKKWRDWFIEVMGFQWVGSGSDRETQTEVVSNCLERENPHYLMFAVSSPLSVNSKVARFLQHRPPGVGDVAFRVVDLEGLTSESVEELKTERGSLKWQKIVSVANIEHTLIQRQGESSLLPLDYVKPVMRGHKPSPGITGIDHLVLNVYAGDIEKTVTWYEQHLGFIRQQAFTIQTPRSSLYSQVIIHPVTGLQLPINEPTSHNSQIQEFLEVNRGEGIQHIALKTAKITLLTEKLRSAGLSFLAIPKTYYESIEYQKFNFSYGEWQQLIEQEILIDFESQYGENINGETPLLLQIFTQPVFSKPTFFFELIERRYQARGFGEGNFQALFEAIEREQDKRGSLVI
ncbi:MAG: 4-hydroxyphenylpyruvate dioxygenase [Chroococcopsis gigantea SAG 12.99]|jgi:4-hydroxyphenylpyruvate dioxygenase|nr:4-hydroxyphenylpyruvate dioxygenase [Chlorogloea purpurea SAG 13.99]MDV3000779.1 4-hydroxyphenylpyruvate dioxygenase [Chroococcopsis gigantea SAG 12.99]